MADHKDIVRPVMVVRPFVQNRFLNIDNRLWDIYEATVIKDKHGNVLTPTQIETLQHNLHRVNKNYNEEEVEERKTSMNWVILKDGDFDPSAKYSLTVGRMADCRITIWKLRRQPRPPRQ